MKETNVENLPICILKFTDFPDELLNGQIYMNNLAWYIDMEKSENDKGQGDLLEASQVYTDIDLVFRDSKTNEYQFSAKATNMTLRHDGDDKKPVFCSLLLTDKHFIFHSEDEEYVNYILQIDDDVVKHMLETFSKQLVVIFAEHFFCRLEMKAKENDYYLIHKSVSYDDLSVNNFNRIKSYHSDHTSVFFWKDKYFEKQNEYRFVILNEEIDNPMIFEVGDLRDIGFKFNAEEFFDGEFILKTRKKKK